MTRDDCERVRAIELFYTTYLSKIIIYDEESREIFRVGQDYLREKCKWIDLDEDQVICGVRCAKSPQNPCHIANIQFITRSKRILKRMELMEGVGEATVLSDCKEVPESKPTTPIVELPIENDASVSVHLEDQKSEKEEAADSDGRGSVEK